LSDVVINASGGERITAGSTFPYSPVDGAAAPNNTWSACDASTFNLRVGPDYARNGRKAPSAPALLQIVGVDCVRCNGRIDNIGARVDFPPEWTDMPEYQPGVPPLFIVNMQIPSEFPTSIFKEITDGPGWSLVLYFRLTPETAQALAYPDSAPNGNRLYAKYCQNAPEANIHSSSSPWKARFKATMRCQNINEFGLPSFITSYNAKPVLIRNTGTLIRGANYIEMDINVHRFGSVPKQALQVGGYTYHGSRVALRLARVAPPSHRCHPFPGGVLGLVFAPPPPPLRRFSCATLTACLSTWVSASRA
jgi:hypothetical protein